MKKQKLLLVLTCLLVLSLILSVVLAGLLAHSLSLIASEVQISAQEVAEPPNEPELSQETDIESQVVAEPPNEPELSQETDTESQVVDTSNLEPKASLGHEQAEPQQETTPTNDNTDMERHAPIYWNGEILWRFDMEFENDTAETLTLKKIQTIHKLQEEEVAEVIREGDELESMARMNLTGLVIEPGQCSTFEDFHNVVYDMDEVIYIFTYQSTSGETVIKEQDYLLSYDCADAFGDFVDYSGDSGRDLETLRYEADYCVNVASGVYWVPASSLGASSYTNAEIQNMLTDSPQEKADKIDTLYEALQLYQIGNFSSSDDNKRISDSGINWEHHKPGYDAVRTNTGCCATDSNWLRYILDGDYEEVGYMAISQRDGSGHIFNYIKSEGWYYFIDLTHYRTDWVMTAIESGNLSDYANSDLVLGNIHKCQNVQDYVNYVQSTFSDPPGLMFLYTAENCLALDAVPSGSGTTITYETVAGVDVMVVYDDPNDDLYYQFTASPKDRPDYSTEVSFDFGSMKFQ